MNKTFIEEQQKKAEKWNGDVFSNQDLKDVIESVVLATEAHTLERVREKWNTNLSAEFEKWINTPTPLEDGCNKKDA